MDTLVEHVDAEQQLQPVGRIRLEIRKRLVGVGIIGVGFIHCHIRVDPGEPLRHMGYHLVHVLLVGAEHDVLSRFICDMMGKDPIQTIRLLQCPAQRIQIFLVGILNARCPQVVHPSLILCKGFLVLVDRSYIFRGRQNAPDDCFAKGHVARRMPIKELFGHVTVIIQIPDVCCRQPQKLCIRA